MNKEIILVTWGGIGDLLVCTPAIRAVRESYPGYKLIVYCASSAHRQILLNNPDIDSLRRLHPLHMWRYPYHVYLRVFKKEKLKYYHLDFQHIPLTLIYQKSVKEIVPEIMADLNIRLTDKKIRMVFTEQENKKAMLRLAPYPNAVIMHIKSKSSKNHHWPPEKWESLVKEMPDLTFIQIGHMDEPCVKGALDWRGKLKLREALCLLKHARSFVGIDSSMAHATNAFDLPGVVLFGDSTPAIWGQENNINIYKATRCSPCYYYVWNDPCPYGHECMHLITVGEVKQALIRQMSNTHPVASPVKYGDDIKYFERKKAMYHE